MRSALIFDFKLPDLLLNELFESPNLRLEMADCEKNMQSGVIDFAYQSAEFDAVMQRAHLHFDAQWNTFITKVAVPHKDDAFADYTFGVVLRGNHQLFTGNYHPVGSLTAGSCYLLNNKKVHGAKPNNDAREGELLIFSAQDFSAYDMRDALDIVERRVKFAQ